MSKVLVIGESCLDVFQYHAAPRLAPDYPVPILHFNHQTENSGMAMNVKRNLESLGQKCDIVTNGNWQEVTKTRIVHEGSNHTFLRIDSNDKVSRIQWTDQCSFGGGDFHVSRLEDYSAILISDYNKNFLAEKDIEKICNAHPNVFLDTKKILGEWANNARFIKINDYEYQHSLPFLTPDLHKKIIHTQGGKGANYQGRNYPTEEVEVKDASGAGDCFYACFCVEYLKTNNVDLAIRFANKGAAKVVQERGVTTV